MSFEALAAEYEARTVGPLILERVQTIISNLLRKRDPTIYARGAHDWREGLDEVVHEFFEQLLFSGTTNQLEYIFDTSNSIDDFDRLMTRQARRFVARTRKRTVIDNLIVRSWKMAKEKEKLNADKSHIWYDGASESAPAESELKNAASLAQSVPVTYESGKAQNYDPDRETRLAKVFTDTNLGTVLRIVLSSLAKRANRGNMQKIFEFLSGGWSVSVLDQEEGAEIQASALQPDGEILVRTRAQTIVDSWSDEERTIFIYKNSNRSDKDLARALDVSEDTARTRKQAWWKGTASHLEGLEPNVRNEVIDRLASVVMDVGHG